MRAFLRGCAFLIGASIAGVALFVLGFRYPHAWMPLSMGVLIAGIVSYQNWSPKGAFGILYGAAWITGPFLLWLVSSTNMRWMPPGVKMLLTLAVPVALIVALGSLICAFKLPKAERKIALWLLAALAVGLHVAYLSGPQGQAGYMRALLLDLGFSSSAADVITFVGRKTIHFTVYGLLGWFWVKSALLGGLRKPDAAGFALSMTLIVAAFDEIRQSTMIVRSGSAYDVLIDLAGATLFIALTKATKGVRSK